MNLLDKIVNDDFVWDALVSNIGGKRRTSHTNYVNLNCPLCVSRGESRDTKGRLGLKRDSKGIGIYCFNCNARDIFKIGRNTFSPTMIQLLELLGVSSIEVKKMNMKAMELRRMLSNVDTEAFPQMFVPSFPTVQLAKGAKTITQWATEGCTDPNFYKAVEYLYSRGDVIAETGDYYWTPDPGTHGHKLNERLIVPFKFEGRLVGWTGRYFGDDEKVMRYHNDTPSNLISNSRVLNTPREYVVVVEGPFDAIAIDGVSTLGAKLSAEQTQWLKSSGKKIIVLPDRDSAGDRMIEHALTNDWMVSFPRLKEGRGFDNWWEPDLKDAADAVKRYGQLYTVQSIVASATANKLKINMYRKMLF
jgi:hypothetical protein